MNKILLKTAAAVNIAAAAIIYIACSGDDGSKGDPGAPCSASPSATVAGGIDISCPGSAVVTLPPGNAGPGGGSEGCYLQPATSGFDVICGTANVGNIGGPGSGSGCSITTAQGNAYFTFLCGNTTYQVAKALCNYLDNNNQVVAEPYDPEYGVCSPTGAGLSGNCGNAAIDFSTQFCAAADQDGKEGKTVLARCGAKYLQKQDGSGDSTDSKGKNIVKPDSTGEYNPTTQFCLNTAANSFFPDFAAAAGLPSGLVRDLCGTGATVSSKRYLKDDFCSVTNTILPYCQDGTTLATYNPASQFCQAAAAAAQTPVTESGAVIAGVVKPRCGSESYGAATLRGLGSGTYGPDKFCSPLTNAATAATGARLYSKCIVVSSTGTAIGDITPSSNIGTVSDAGVLPGAAMNNGSGTPIPRPAYYARGEYDATQGYCKIAISGASSPYTATLTLERLESCVAGAPAVLDPTRNFCGPSNIIYPICAGKGTKGVASSGAAIVPPATRQDYLVTSEYCDTRGQTFAPNNTASGTVIISGGKLYDYINLAGKDWTVQNLNNAAGLPGSIPSGSTFNWAQATSANTKICPEGWRVPTNAEWNALITLATATNATPALELRDPNHSGSGKWGNDLPIDGKGIGFAAVVSGGNITTSPTYEIKVPSVPYVPADIISAGNPAKTYAAWWTSDDDAINQVSGTDRNNGIFRYFFSNDAVVKTGSGNKLSTALNVRCVRE